SRWSKAGRTECAVGLFAFFSFGGPARSHLFFRPAPQSGSLCLSRMRYTLSFGLTDAVRRVVPHSGRRARGQVAERSKATGCKPVALWGYGGSNPPLSTRVRVTGRRSSVGRARPW